MLGTTRRMSRIGLSALVAAGAVVVATSQTAPAKPLDDGGNPEPYSAACVAPGGAKATDKGLCIRYQGRNGGELDVWHDFEQEPLDPKYRIQVMVDQPGRSAWQAELVGTSQPKQGTSKRLYNFKTTINVGSNFAAGQSICLTEWYRIGDGTAGRSGQVCYKFDKGLVATATTAPSSASSAPPTEPAPATASSTASNPAEQPKQAPVGQHEDSGKGTLVNSCVNPGDKALGKFGQIGSEKIEKDGKLLGWLQIFYSTAQGGTNCAQVVHKDAPLTVPVRTVVEMKLNKPVNENGKETKKHVWDRGQYNTRAGGVYFTGSDNKCIDVDGMIGDTKVGVIEKFCGSGKK